MSREVTADHQSPATSAASDSSLASPPAGIPREVGIAAAWIVALVILPALAAGLWTWWQFEHIPRRSREAVDDPGRDFAKTTGLPWPGSARVLVSGDSHGGFHGDGEFYLVFDADRSALEQWLEAPPPWGASQWRPGPIPSEIGSHCGFGQERPAVSRDEEGLEEYWGGSP